MIHFSRFRCTGSELNLTSCSHSLPESYCSHSYDSGVLCRGKLINKFITLPQNTRLIISVSSSLC